LGGRSKGQGNGGQGKEANDEGKKQKLGGRSEMEYGKVKESSKRIKKAT